MQLDHATIARSARSLSQPIDPADVVDRLYIIADLMEATDKAIGSAWAGVEAGPHLAAVEKALTDYDFLMNGRDLRKIADTWQETLDREVV